MTRDPLNMRLLPANHTGKYDFPTIARYDGEIPSELIPFNYARSYPDRKVGVHFFIDDYQFERLWRFPDRYIPLLQEYDCVLTPDFSIYVDMPLTLKIYNVYRNRVLGHYWQQNGINVIPTLQWADYRSFDFCFSGIEPCGIVAVSTLGSAQNPQSRGYWIAGMKQAIDKLQPTTVLLYGTPIDFDFGNIMVIHYENIVLNRLRNR